MKNRYFPLIFVFALGLITHSALCMDDSQENKDTKSVTPKKNIIVAHTFTQTSSDAFGDWTFKLPRNIGYGATWGKHSNETFTFKTPDVQENL
jgi:hypothetical protein